MGSAPYVFVALMVTHAVLVGADHNDCEHTLQSAVNMENCGKVKKANLTQSDIDDLVKFHNHCRHTLALGKQKMGSGESLPTSKRILDLTWSDKIAERAQAWANQCTYNHVQCSDSKKFDFGQNNEVQASPGNWLPSINDTIAAWYDEAINFNPEHIKPFVLNPNTTRYTQIVWGDTLQLGCGAVWHFKENNNVTWSYVYVVCFYHPRGNVIGATMYETN